MSTCWTWLGITLFLFVGFSLLTVYAALVMSGEISDEERVEGIPPRQCAICGQSNIKLYRPYGEFLRKERFRCGRHVPDKEKNWYVPLVEDDDGSVWGYTSSPPDAIRRWKAQHD